jgi:hypothetical protein
MDTDEWSRKLEEMPLIDLPPAGPGPLRRTMRYPANGPTRSDQRTHRSRALVVDAARAYWAQLRGLRLYMDAAFVLPQLKPVGFAIRTYAPSHRYGFGVVFTS